MAALAHTLAVEAAVHHLDLSPVLPGAPDEMALSGVRRVLDGLLGVPAPAHWDDVAYVMVGTGRRRLTATEAADVGPLAALFPLFG